MHALVTHWNAGNFRHTAIDQAPSLILVILQGGGRNKEKPVVPIGSRVRKITSRLNDELREEIGWPDLARSVANVYHSLRMDEQQRSGILAGNYGEAGALNLYGPSGCLMQWA